MRRPGFRIDMLASGFRDPRFLLTAPNGDIFVVESRRDQIKVIRGAHAGTVELFAEAGLNKPFGIAFYPPGEDPQFLYVANTDGVIRFPYRNGDLKVRGPVEKLKAQLSGGAGFLRSGGIGRATLFSRPTEKRCTFRSVRARIIPTMPAKRTARAFLSSTRTAQTKTFTPGEFATPSASLFALAGMSFG